MPTNDVSTAVEQQATTGRRVSSPESKFVLTVIEQPGLVSSLWRHFMARLREPRMTRDHQYYRGEVDLPLTGMRPWFLELPRQLKYLLEKPSDPVGIYNRNQSFRRLFLVIALTAVSVATARITWGGIEAPLAAGLASIFVGWLMAALIFRKREYLGEIVPGSGEHVFVDSSSVFVSLYRQIREQMREPKITVPPEFYRGEVTLPVSEMRSWWRDLPQQIGYLFEKPADPISLFNRTQEFKRAGVTALLALAGALAGWAIHRGAGRTFLLAVAGVALGRVLATLIFKKQEYPPGVLQDYQQQTASWVNSLLVHLVAVAAMVLPFVIKSMNQPVKASTKYEVTDISPYLASLKPAPKQAGGGGGGGDRSPTPASKGAVPKFALQQLSPPLANIINTEPKLPVQPTLLGPPELKLPQMAQNMPWGDPNGVPGPPSNGPGTGGGIGTGTGTGIGSGRGGGLGPGEGGGTGGGIYSVGGGVSAPIPIYSPDPPYSEEARKAKYAGTVVLQIIVDQQGNVRDARVVKPLGLGLDEKAIETIRTWRFKPALKNGSPVPVRMLVEVSFRLL